MEKIKTSKQRILVAILTLCMLFTLFAPAANVNAASKRTKALTAYQKKLTRLDSRYNKFASTKILYRNFLSHQKRLYILLPVMSMSILVAN